MRYLNVNYDDYRLIGIPLQSQLIRETRLLQNRNYLYANQQRLLVLLSAEIILALNCLIGDYYIFNSNALIDLIRHRFGLSERLVRALLDNASHFTVAFLSWFIATYQVDSSSATSFSFKGIFFAGFMASIIDIDHFLAAGSMRLESAISLPKRPFLHNSLTMSIANVAVYIVLRVISNSSISKRVSSMFFVAWFTHHVRDANRRGLWFGPLFTTPPIKRTLYLGIILILPLFLRYDLTSWFKSSMRLFTLAFNKSTTSTTHII